MEYLGFVKCMSVSEAPIGKFCVTGKAGWAAPRLKDAALSLDKLREGYLEVLPDLFFFYPTL